MDDRQVFLGHVSGAAPKAGLVTYRNGGLRGYPIDPLRGSLCRRSSIARSTGLFSRLSLLSRVSTNAASRAEVRSSRKQRYRSSRG